MPLKNWPVGAEFSSLTNTELVEFLRLGMAEKEKEISERKAKQEEDKPKDQDK